MSSYLFTRRIHQGFPFTSSWSYRSEQVVGSLDSGHMIGDVLFGIYSGLKSIKTWLTGPYGGWAFETPGSCQITACLYFCSIFLYLGCSLIIFVSGELVMEAWALGGIYCRRPFSSELESWWYLSWLSNCYLQHKVMLATFEMTHAIANRLTGKIHKVYITELRILPSSNGILQLSFHSVELFRHTKYINALYGDTRQFILDYCRIFTSHAY